MVIFKPCSQKTCPVHVRTPGLSYWVKHKMSLPKRTQVHTPLENELARTGVARPAPIPTPKPGLQPPVGRGGPLWHRLYEEAVQTKHPFPEKFADSILRAREHAARIEAARRKLVHDPDYKPKPNEAAATAPAKAKKKPVVHDAFRCKALTLEGRRCGFKATCGDFCKKHSTTEKM